VASAINVVHKEIVSKSVVVLISNWLGKESSPQNTKLEPFSVSVLDMIMNPPFSNPFFNIGVYIYCPGVPVLA